MQLTAEEQGRLDGLIARFGYGPARELLVQFARPCISLFLEDIPESGEQRTIALGASRMGGVPDLPADMPWPIVDDGFVIEGEKRRPGYAGFLLQIALDDMPELVDQPLPSFGQVYVFDLGPSRPFRSSFLVRYSPTAKTDLQRIERPADLPCAAEPFCFESGDGFAIKGERGIDFLPMNQDELELYRQIADLMGANDLSGGVLEAYGEFERAARDSNALERAARGYPHWWWSVGYLFGATQRSLDGQIRAAGSSPLMTIESNTLVEYSSPADCAPIQLSMPRDAQRPWTNFDRVTAEMIG
jgi:hypothetical protein